MGNWFIGVDGGGTKTAFVVGKQDGKIAASFLDSGCSYQEIGIDAVVALLSNGIHKVLSKAMVSFNDCAGCVIGLALCEQAAKSGYTSVMIDGSKLPICENILLVNQVVAMAAKTGICPAVEAELGRLKGKEDSVETAEGSDIYTNPNEAARFVEETGIDSLALAIGTAHGFYKGIPKLDFARLEAIRNTVSVLLVLHGSSGIPDADIVRAISLGVCKVNFATELRAAYTAAVRELLANDTAIYDPKKFGAAGREAVVQIVRHRIAICSGS